MKVWLFKTHSFSFILHPSYFILAFDGSLSLHIAFIISFMLKAVCS
jgi:hypothetical protein